MLDEVALSCSVAGSVIEQVTYDFELVVARPDLGVVDFLGVVLDDVGEASRRQYFFPEVVGLEPVGIDRVAGGAVVAAFVEGQEDGGFACKLGAEHGLVLVDCEMDGASADVEQVLTRTAGLSVLLDGVAHRLLGEVVLELEGGDGQAVDEER